MPITLPDETKKHLTDALRGYFRDEFGQEIGALQASFLLDFVLQEVGPSIYNQAIRDAQAHLQAIVSDLDLSLHAPEAAAADRRPPR